MLVYALISGRSVGVDATVEACSAGDVVSGATEVDGVAVVVVVSGFESCPAGSSSGAAMTPATRANERKMIVLDEAIVSRVLLALG